MSVSQHILNFGNAFFSLTVIYMNIEIEFTQSMLYETAEVTETTELAVSVDSAVPG